MHLNYTLWVNHLLLKIKGGKLSEEVIGKARLLWNFLAERECVWGVHLRTQICH